MTSASIARSGRRLSSSLVTSLALIVTALAMPVLAQAITPKADQRPNVVVILVDDAGLTDFTPFGGEAKMPTIPG